MAEYNEQKVKRQIRAMKIISIFLGVVAFGLLAVLAHSFGIV